jgi:hypothetical protein
MNGKFQAIPLLKKMTLPQLVLEFVSKEYFSLFNITKPIPAFWGGFFISSYGCDWHFFNPRFAIFSNKNL